MGVLNRDQIVGRARQLPTRDVPCPELGGSVRVRALKLSEREALEEAAINNRAKDGTYKIAGLTAKYVVTAAVGDDGQPLFTDADLPWLQDEIAGVVERLYEAIRDLSGLTKASQEAVAKN